MEEPVRLSVIVARSKNGIIGKDGGLPWKLGDDLKLFKQTTMGKPIIMGRNTWESLPLHPLPKRQNIVITRDWAYAAEGARVYSNLNAAIQAAKAIAVRDGEDEVFVIGGQSLYTRVLPIADVLYIREIEADIVGDVFLPEFDENSFREVAVKTYERNCNNEFSFKFRVLERQK